MRIYTISPLGFCVFVIASTPPLDNRHASAEADPTGDTPARSALATSCLNLPGFARPCNDDPLAQSLHRPGQRFVIRQPTVERIKSRILLPRPQVRAVEQIIALRGHRVDRLAGAGVAR